MPAAIHITPFWSSNIKSLHSQVKSKQCTARCMNQYKDLEPNSMQVFGSASKMQVFKVQDLAHGSQVCYLKVTLVVVACQYLKL